MLMLKFGRLVDLEKLETVTVNRTVEELKEKLRQQESKSAAEIAKWNVSENLLQTYDNLQCREMAYVDYRTIQGRYGEKRFDRGLAVSNILWYKSAVAKI